MTERDRHLKASDVFAQAIELPREERDAFLENACAGDESLLSEVRSLLAHDIPEPDGEGVASPRGMLQGLAPGQEFGQYKLEEEIGSGGMGVVWKARHPLLGRHDALKFLSPQLARVSDARERFIREGRSASALKHSGIATVYSAGETDGKVYIALEYIDGETVSEVTSRGPLAAAEAFRVAILAGKAIGYAHTRKVLHRDVTSRNIMITRDGNVVVVDFGLAVVQGATRFTQSGAVVGTIPYMAPELFIGSEATASTDVYSLGVVLYEMLAGGLPFHGEYPAALMWAITNRDAEPVSKVVPGLPVEIDRIIAKALAKEPQARYRSADEFVADLEILLQSGVLPDVPPEKALVRAPQAVPALTPIPSATTRRRRKRNVIALIVALAALTIVGIKWGPNLIGSGAKPAFASVAVLPFEVIGPADQLPDWMLAGLAEQLTIKLAQLDRCRVATWTSSRRFSTKDQSVRDVARNLGVEAVVLVSLRSEGNDVKGSISVVDGKDEFVRWSEDIETRQSDLLGMERELATAVAEGLFGPVSGPTEEALSVPPSQSAEAFELYLKGGDAMQTSTPDANGRALAFFERAVELDPRFADGFVGIGAVHANRHFFGWEGGQRSLDLAEENFRRALALDPSNLAAKRGVIRVHWERIEVEEGLKLASEIDIGPNAGVEALLTRAQAYVFLGLPLKAIPLTERGLAIEPTHQGVRWWQVVAFAWGKEFEACIASGEEYFSRFGDEPEVHLWVAFSYENLSMIEEATVHYRRALELFGDNTEFYGSLLAVDFFLRNGMSEMANDELARVTRSMTRSLGSYPDNAKVLGYLCAAYSMRGDREQFLKAVAQFQSLGASSEASAYIASAYYTLGLKDEGGQALCDAVAHHRFEPIYAMIAGAAARERMLADPQGRACLEESDRWFAELARRY
jgi:serine/threonine protein kinase/TolB-like protein/tetratricopeptide (TPR) repeat protein